MSSGRKFHFFISWRRVKGIFPFGFSFFFVLGYFSKGMRIFPGKNYFIPRKLQFRTVQLKKTVSYNFFPDKMPKIQKNWESWR